MMQQYAKRLDRTRDHGTYHPPMEGAFYNQDGYDFDHEGRIVEARLTQEQREHLAKRPARAATPTTVKAVKATEPAKVEDDPSPEAGEDASDGLNLEMWLRGEADYPFPDVQKAVRTRFNIWKTGKRDLVLFLVEEQKLIAADELSDEYKAMVA